MTPDHSQTEPPLATLQAATPEAASDPDATPLGSTLENAKPMGAEPKKSASPERPPENSDTCSYPLPPHEQLANLFDELFGRAWKAGDPYAGLVDMTATEIARHLQTEMPDHVDDFKQLFGYSSAAGVLLAKLAAVYPQIVQKRILDGAARWSVLPGGWHRFSQERYEMKASA